MTAARELRVLCLTNMWPRDDHAGYGSFVHSQMDSVARRGVRVTVNVIDGRTNKLAYLGAALRFIGRNWRSQPYDLIHAHTGHCGVVASLQRRTPVVVSYVGYDLYGTPVDESGRISRKSALEAWLFRRLPRVVSGTITKSRRMEQLLPTHAQGGNLVLPNGVDRARFRPVPKDEARGRLGWPRETPIALFAANPTNPRKRYDVASEAVAVCQKSVPGIELRVCWGVDPVDVPLLMSAADVLVHPSIAEGSPNVVKEALACDLPVIATDVGDVPELLAGVRNCHVTERTPAAFAEAIREVLRSGDRSDGRAKTSPLSIENVADELVRFYARHSPRG
ncbi:MAG: glycosyltransferase family 4 protein [Patulibacter sp.]|nr:glycosyltransferase family 4 protein [Patulibacter sp.]